MKKIAIVTGAGRGIGRAVAKALFHEGFYVAAISRTKSTLISLSRELPGPSYIWRAGDAADPGTVSSFIKVVLKRFGRIDVLVNNAGVLTPMTAFSDIAIKDWDESLRINLRGPFLWTKATLPVMLRQKAGRILNVSSGVGKREAPGWGPYAVSKFGLEGLSLSADAEVRDQGVRVLAVNPGGTRTKMRAAAFPNEDPLTLPSPEEVARFFVWLAKGGKVKTPSVDYRDWAKNNG
jgi:NAD(P)-dependent dehydrogenase (short-subunit alcohol dehydrogenase family)